MAASMAASRLSHFPQHAIRQSSPSDTPPLTTFKPYDFHPKRCRSLSIRALLQGENDLNKNAQALELRRRADDFPSDVVSKDTLALRVISPFLLYYYCFFLCLWEFNGGF